ncbi:hypothetical protein B0T11DRAFT_254646 [Plectosphaerella cucumerina]|uniref:T6SS Phospholipase effector Tle1-like catalytic domain-containing protein n=1 Tax=Plectosphaerella cucumerina TaxID=40658 RepID=A0A8K0TTM3_9PEZI|nr:hypothetical protein B0T11DRAFT_254646 [Plectosphaerella cucumerina]
MGAPKRVVVLCDGTWCGRDTKTKSNIFYLASMMGIDMTGRPAEYITTDICAAYFDGVGMNADFMSYLWNGALALEAKKECTKVYEFIVKHSAWDSTTSTEVWMFGISRGAYIVRSVGGMINNCGILKDETNATLITEVYDIYRSAYAVHHPASKESHQFRQRVSYGVKTPVKFMGLFDTVGSLGVPTLDYNTGSGFEWPQFHDDLISSAVAKVYHATAIHDRFWGFEPCLASRDAKHDGDEELQIQQRWFPGCHYDLARQEFQFLREGGSTLERLTFPVLNLFSNTISPNEKLADLVLLWILRAVRAEGGGAIIQRNMWGGPSTIDAEIPRIVMGIAAGNNGSGDKYDRILDYLPGGRVLSAPIAWLKSLNATTYAILFNPVDRFIPHPGMNNDQTSAVWNSVYNFHLPDFTLNGVIIGQVARVTGERYPSQSLPRYLAYMAAVGKDPWAC